MEQPEGKKHKKKLIGRVTRKIKSQIYMCGTGTSKERSSNLDQSPHGQLSGAGSRQDFFSSFYTIWQNNQNFGFIIFI
jgi:hypothetical protein